jgi:23S rRNA pseudouridine955/2504/2580 synthase
MTSSDTKTNLISNPVQFIDISAAQAGQRIDNFLLTLEKGVPKSRIYRAIRKGEVRVNKGRIKQTYKIQAGDSVRVPPLHVSEDTTPTTVSEFLRRQLTESILLEDDDLLVLNKPCGLAVHAGSNIQQGIIEALRVIRAELPFLELVHRLDRDTSGCLLLAKNRDALLNLQQQMINHDLNKRYLTLLKGSWGSEERLIEQPLLKNTVSSGERMVRVDPEGKYAKTVFIPVESFKQAQLTEVVLYTGRTHQIRVHAHFMQTPMAGDDKYGQRNFNKDMKKFGLKRMFLHAWKLGITHPTTNEAIMLEAPLPEQLENVLAKLRQQA